MNWLRSSLQSFTHIVIAYRLVLSLGVAAAASIMLHALWPWPAGVPLLHYFALERPHLYIVAAHGYDLFLFTTPFLLCSMLFSLLYVHMYRRESEVAAGSLPPLPDPGSRHSLALVLGEVHHQLRPEPSAAPRWLEIPSAAEQTITLKCPSTVPSATTRSTTRSTLTRKRSISRPSLQPSGAKAKNHSGSRATRISCGTPSFSIASATDTSRWLIFSAPWSAPGNSKTCSSRLAPVSVACRM